MTTEMPEIVPASAEDARVAIINEPDRVVMEGEWVSEVILDVMTDGDETTVAFEALFEIVPGHHMGDPKESYYQGIEWTALIRRKSDGRLFGYPFWAPVAKYDSEAVYEENGEEHGFESTFNDDYTEYLRGPFWVWLPVEPFTITGYKIAN